MDARARLAAVLGRLFVLSAPLWEEVAQWRETVEEALVAVLSGRIESSASLIGRLERFDVEDDASASWGYGVALLDTLLHALAGEVDDEAVAQAVRRYLDATYDTLSFRLADACRRPVTDAEVEAFAATDAVWRRANQFAEALL